MLLPGASEPHYLEEKSGQGWTHQQQLQTTTQEQRRQQRQEYHPQSRGHEELGLQIPKPRGPQSLMSDDTSASLLLFLLLPPSEKNQRVVLWAAKKSQPPQQLRWNRRYSGRTRRWRHRKRLA
ncbi:hypothetical protein MRB53_032496 [Persea americana]|uniref:Uncharacterized protein n=1 Tax=Persea americana TaxID=3435 RepID=A0ACC2KRX3_PERAE|nr:hypothetical protein MRB53_032496 [Persea americana]